MSRFVPNIFQIACIQIAGRGVGRASACDGDHIDAALLTQS